MNRARVRFICDEIARLQGELADALLEEGDEESTTKPAKKLARPTFRKPRLVRPEGESSPEAAARAERILRGRGYR